MLLSEFLELAVCLDSNRNRADSDFVLAGPRCGETAYPEILLVADGVSDIPLNWIRSSWNPLRRNHTAPVHFCPDCLRHNEGRAVWSWRFRFVPTCCAHSRFLISRCPECGEVFRFRQGLGARAFSHWLDQWAFCSSCGTETGFGALAPRWLARSADIFLKADSPVFALSMKLVDTLNRDRGCLSACSSALELPDACDHAACVASAMILGFQERAYLQETEAGRELAMVALTGVANSRSLPDSICETVSCWKC